MGKMPHIAIDESIGATAAILPGDPARVNAIAAMMDDAGEVTFNREYHSMVGTYKGRRILAISTGMGGASTAICVEELADLGFRDLIRVGSCGALQKKLRLGELVICDSAVCDDGTSQSYLNYLRYAGPEADGGRGGWKEDELCRAFADPVLVEACKNAALAKGFAFSVGPTRSHDALYLKKKPQLDEYYSQKGVYGSDMETAALFAVAKERGLRAASILNVVVEWKTDIKEGVGNYREGALAAACGEEHEILTALEALAAVKQV